MSPGDGVAIGFTMVVAAEFRSCVLELVGGAFSLIFGDELRARGI